MGTFNINSEKAIDITNEIVFEEQCSNGFGNLIIQGLVFPDNPDFDPLGKIWSSLKKRIDERYHVNVTGIFFYDPDVELISCNFCLNYAPLEKNQLDIEDYIQRYHDTFSTQMTLFENTIHSFILDTENGYLPYLRCIESIKDIEDGEERREIFDLLFDNFLKSCGIKTEADDKKKKKKKSKLEQAKKQFQTMFK